MEPKNREDLDRDAAAGCTMPDCDHKHHDGTIWFHARCHPRADVGVYYEFGTGTMHVVCGQCRRPVVDIAVASGAGN